MRDHLREFSFADRDAQRNVKRIPTAPTHRHILFEFTNKSAKKLIVEPPATSGIWSLVQLLSMTSLTLFCSLHGAERIETVVGQACQCIGLHSNCLRLTREACFDQERWY